MLHTYVQRLDVILLRKFWGTKPGLDPVGIFSVVGI